MTLAITHNIVGLIMLLLLAWAAWTDLFDRLILNRVSLLLLALWPAHVLLAPEQVAVWSHLAVGLGVFIVGYVLWLGGTIGGGDVKLLSAVALWAGPEHAPSFLLVTACLGGALALAYLVFVHSKPILAYAACRLGLPDRVAALALAENGRAPTLPYAVAIAGGGVWLLPRLTPLFSGIAL